MSFIINSFVFAAAGGGGLPDLDLVFMAGAEHEANANQKWDIANAQAPVAGVAGAHGSVYDNATWGTQNKNFPATQFVTVKTRIRFRVSSDGQSVIKT